MPRTKDFAEVIRQKLAADPALAEAVEEAAFHAHIAGQIYEARIGAGLTQLELAKRAGTQQSVIARLEDADYYGHSNKLIRRVAAALGMVARVDLYAKPVVAKGQNQITARFVSEDSDLLARDEEFSADELEFEPITTVTSPRESLDVTRQSFFANELSP